MTVAKKIELLENILLESASIIVENCEDPNFKIWKISTIKIISNIFGSNSLELKEIKNLNFFYVSEAWNQGKNYDKENLISFKNDMIITRKLVRSYINEIKENSQEQQMEINMELTKKVFISHSSKDYEIVEEVIEILEVIGLNSNQIFCSSFPGYGIDLGENFLDRLKNELSERVIVIFILSENFYSSPICLCEMGATWVKTNEHIPILIPPLKYEDVKGVIPLTQGLKINESLKLNLLKEKIEKLFILQPIDYTSWERKRDRILERLSTKINK